MGGTLTALVMSELSRSEDHPVHFESRDGRRVFGLRSLVESARRFAGGLRECGIGPGDRVAMQLPNSPEQLVVQFACLMTGAVLAPIVPVFGAAEVSAMLGQALPKVFVTRRAWRRMDFMAQWAEVDASVRPDRLVLVEGVEPGDPGEAVAFDDVAGAATLDAVHLPRSTDVCLMLFTSGSSGSPKGVLHTHDGLLHEAREVAYFVRERADRPQILQATAAGHIGGAMYAVRMLLHRNVYRVIDWWDLDLAVRAIADDRIRVFGGTPFHLISIMERAAELGLDLTSLSQVTLGGAPVDPAVIIAADAVGITAVRGYGSTEHPTLTTGDHMASLEERAHFDGRPNAWSRIRVIDDEDADVATGERGEIVTQGGELFAGYANPTAADPFTPDGWFRTGDIGTIGETGLLTVVDRKKNIIIRGGENLSIAEMERGAAGHPDVAELAVIGIPDPRYGERACAFVVPKAGRVVTLESLREYCVTAGVSRQKIPETIEIVDALPHGGLQKVRRDELKRLWRSRHPADGFAPTG